MRDRLLKIFLIFIVMIITYQFGFKQFISNDYYMRTSRENNMWAKDKVVEEPGRYAVVVVGEEPEGVAAAIASARSGVKTLLISEEKDLGGVISKSWYTYMGESFGAKGEALNRGIFDEIKDNMGNDLSPNKYIQTVEKMVKKEDNLDVIYSAGINSHIIEKGELKSINIKTGTESISIYGRRFVDATRDGKILEMCAVPYKVGSEDINLKDRFYPVNLNFEVEGISQDVLKKLVSDKKSKIYLYAYKYEPSHLNIRVKNFNMINSNDGKVIIQGLNIYNLNLNNKKDTQLAYNTAVEEAKEFTQYLSKQMKELKDIKFTSAAEEFYIREYKHFKGEYTLGVNEVLENKDFSNKIALCSNPLDGSKFIDKISDYVIGKPTQYSIPLGCIVPVKIDNLLMVGNKISYSSMVSSSASSHSLNISVGQSAGIVAVYSLVKNITPRELLSKKSPKEMEEMQRILKRCEVYLPDFKYKNINTDNWSYNEVRQLNSLGLVAGGNMNSYFFGMQAKSQDLAILIANGVLRMSPEKYSLKFDGRLRPYFKDEKLTKVRAGEILCALYGEQIKGEAAYKRACEKKYISDNISVRLKDKNVLIMDEVYYLAAYNLKRYTGKEIPK